ncbi:MAG: dihydroneopterin aldolase [Saprospiraceae bacterium]
MNTDRIGIEGIKIFAHHGYFEMEQKLGKEFTIDVYLTLELKESGESDKIRDTFNYMHVISICEREMAITSKLLEHVAHRIAIAIKEKSNLLHAVTVRISKPQPLLPIQINRFFVEVNV